MGKIYAIFESLIVSDTSFHLELKQIIIKFCCGYSCVRYISKAFEFIKCLWKFTGMKFTKCSTFNMKTKSNSDVISKCFCGFHIPSLFRHSLGSFSMM